MEDSRRLAAIMFTDIQAYTKLMQESEKSALEIRRRHRDIFEPVTRKFKGEIIQYYGDGTLSIFNSAVDAVRCACELQKRFLEKPLIPVRIGIHMGEIVLYENDIIGDSVNLASRFESAGLAGSIMVSGKVVEEIKNHEDLPYKHLGRFHFKNDNKPRDVYAISLPGLVIPRAGDVKGKFEEDKLRRIFRRPAVLLIAAVVLAAFMFSIWKMSINTDETNYSSLAVLPLLSRVPNPAQEYLLEGVHDALISELQRSGVPVKARTTMLQYRNPNKPVREIARELNVGALVEGTVLNTTRDSLSFEIRLIDGNTEEYFWSELYATDLRDVVSVYHKVVQNIADEIHLNLSPDAQARLRESPIINPEAYKAYLRGQSEWFKLTPAALKTSLTYFERARQIDPGYAPAYAGIASVWVGLMQQGLVDPETALPRLERDIEVAMQLDSTLPEVYYTLALASWSKWDWETCDRAFRKAIELNPNYTEAIAYYSNFLAVIKRFDESLKYIEKTLELDPFNPLWQGLNGMIMNFTRQHDKVIENLVNTLKNTPNDPVALSTLKTTYHLNGMYDKAYNIWKQTYEFNNDTAAVSALEHGYKSGGYKKALEGLAELMIIRSRSSYITPWRIATMYTRAGIGEKALHWLERAYEEHDANMPFINVDPIFDYIRNEPRFIALLEKLNLPDS